MYNCKSQASAWFYLDRSRVTALVQCTERNVFTVIVLSKSWGSESDRMKEKLLVLIGRIGKEARVGKITTKVHYKINQCTVIFTCTSDSAI